MNPSQNFNRMPHTRIVMYIVHQSLFLPEVLCASQFTAPHSFLNNQAAHADGLSLQTHPPP